MIRFTHPDIRVYYVGALNGVIKTTPGARNYYGSLLEPDNDACKHLWIEEPVGTSISTYQHLDLDSDGTVYANNNIKVCPEGDLMLILIKGNRVVRTPVSSKLMSDSSPVWGRMLDRTSPLCSVVIDGYIDNEKKKNEGGRTWDTLTLKEDDQLAMCILLHTLHRREGLTPGIVDADQLFNIAVICDKYDCAGALLEIHDAIRNVRLVSMWADHRGRRLAKLGWEGWLLIADVFGLQSLEEVAWRVSQELSITGERVEDWSIGTIGDLSSARGLSKRDGRYLSYVSDRITDWIVNARKLQLEFIMREHMAIRDFLFSGGPPTPMIRCLAEDLDLFSKKYSASDIILNWSTFISPSKRDDSNNCSHNRCVDLKLESRLRNWILEKNGDDPEKYEGSVMELLATLEKMYRSHDLAECTANNASSRPQGKECLAPFLVMTPSEEFMNLLKRLYPERLGPRQELN